MKLKTSSLVATELVAAHLYWPMVCWPTWESCKESLCLESREMVMFGWVVRRRWGALYQLMLSLPTVLTLHSKVTSSQEGYTVQVSWMLTTGGSCTDWGSYRVIVSVILYASISTTSQQYLSI